MGKRFLSFFAATCVVLAFGPQALWVQAKELSLHCSPAIRPVVAAKRKKTKISKNQKMLVWLRRKYKKFTQTKFGKWCKQHKKALIVVPATVVGTCVALKSGHLGLQMAIAGLLQPAAVTQRQIFNPCNDPGHQLTSNPILPTKAPDGRVASAVASINSRLPRISSQRRCYQCKEGRCNDLKFRLFEPPSKSCQDPVVAPPVAPPNAEQPKGLILAFVGRKQTTEGMAANKHLQPLSNATGWHVLCFNYPGAAGSNGYPLTADGAAQRFVDAFNAWRNLSANKTFKTAPVVVMGYSLGGLMASLAAKKLGDSTPLVVQRSFKNTALVIGNVTNGWLPLWLIKCGVWLAGWDYDVEELIQARLGATLVFNHKNDELMTQSVDLKNPHNAQPFGKTQFSGADHKMVTVDGKGDNASGNYPHHCTAEEHLFVSNSDGILSGQTFYGELNDFLESVLKSPASGSSSAK